MVPETRAFGTEIICRGLGLAYKLCHSIPGFEVFIQSGLSYRPLVNFLDGAR